MNNTLYMVAAVCVIALMTWVTRGLPYLLFSRRKPPRWVRELGAMLPAAIMVILVAYCLRNTQWTAAPYGAAEILSVLLVAGVQAWRKNTMLSVLVGTVCYMVLIRTVFVV
jgi:branched-subunit amino acid transport protein AzlD